MKKRLSRSLSALFVLVLLFTLALPAYAGAELDLPEATEPVQEAELPAPTEPAAEENVPVQEEETAPVQEQPAAEGEEPSPEPTENPDGAIAVTERAAVLTPGAEEAALDYAEIYVSAAGSDDGDGSIDAPFASLTRAANAANTSDKGTVYVLLLSDLTVSQTVRFYGRNVILRGENGTVTVSRGGGFLPAADGVRGSYNPAMIEVGSLDPSNDGSATALTLENLVLDDVGAQEGSVYRLPALSSDESNADKVQDAIVAVYGNSRLTLNPGAELRNFGGMSAVYAAGGSEAVLEDYSVITDTAALPAHEGAEPILKDADSSIWIGTYATVQSARSVIALAEPKPDNSAIKPAVLAGDTPISFTAPKSLAKDQDKGADGNYSVPYTLNFALTDTIASMIKTLGTALPDDSALVVELSAELDSRLDLKLKEDGTPDYSFNSKSFTESLAVSGKTLTVTLTLKDLKSHLNELTEATSLHFTGILPEANYAEGESLSSTAALKSVTAGDRSLDAGQNVSAEAKTKMLGEATATLIYDINGGEGGPDPLEQKLPAQTYTLESENVPTHVDTNGKPVVFAGWTKKMDSRIYAAKETKPATEIAVDLKEGETTTVYAVYGYDENEDGTADVMQELVTLTYDANGGSGAPDPVTEVAKAGIGVSINISETEPTRRYYKFLGWSKDKNATTADYKYDAQKKADRDILITKDTTLYAVWEKNPTYTLYYNGNGGTNVPAAQSGVSENGVVNLTITSGVPTRNGYTFKGWSPTRSGSASYFAGDKVQISGGNVTLYAVWERSGSGYSGGGNGTSSGRNPKTGDESNLTLYMILLIASLALVAVIAWWLLKKRKAAK